MAMPEQTQLRISLYEHLPAACYEYDPRAAEVAARVADLITARASGVVVEHIGSTAVAGCAGKGVVDLMALYEGGGLSELKTILDRLGFQKQTTRDPFPESRPMRVGAIEHEGKIFRLHVHVIEIDSEEATELRRFRDRLREDENLKRDYIARKQAIIQSGIIDTIDYSEAKGSFIKEALDLSA
jgi:GrpB-like predicted nucleotidyltransferase (UPF0157 family)